ncbi:MAG TPA: NAD(+)/NADH kinase [Coriobacteriia bacterium]
MRIQLVPNGDNPLACETARMLADALPSHGHEVAMAPDDASACGIEAVSGPASAAGLVVALGGDGTVLRAAHSLAGAAVPVLGVKLGRLGFLCGTGEMQPLDGVLAAAAGEGRIESRSTLSATLVVGGRETGVHEALNEVFVGRGGTFRAVDLEVEVDGERLARWVCDGVVVATPTGSTAYALSAGGPLVAPDVRAIIVVPVGPHSLVARPFVLGEGSRVVLTLPDPSRADASVLVDGDLLPCRSALESVEVRMGADDVLLVRLGGRGFAASLRDTFLPDR